MQYNNTTFLCHVVNVINVLRLLFENKQVFFSDHSNSEFELALFHD